MKKTNPVTGKGLGGGSIIVTASGEGDLFASQYIF
jgi:hypothetical protein